MADRPRVIYPPAPRSEDVDRLAGHTFPDPFRPLENDDAPEVIAWQKAQAGLADAYVAALPWTERLRARVERYSDPGDIYNFDVPRFAGGRWFRKVMRAGEAQARVVVADDPAGGGRVVLEPAEHLDEDGRMPYVSWLSPSPDGRVLAVGLCHDGSEANTIRLVDVDTGVLLDDRPPQLLMDGFMGGAQWLADSSGFLYVAFHGTREDNDLRIFRHQLGQPPRAEPEDVPLVDALKWRGVFVSRDGRWAVACQDLLAAKPVAVSDLAGDGRWRRFVDQLDVSLAGHVVGDTWIAVTYERARRGRLVALSLTEPPTGDPAAWCELLPESDAVMRSVRPVGDLLYVTELVDTYARVRIADRSGNVVGEVPLPGRGALAESPLTLCTLAPRGHPDEYLFGFSSLTQSWGVYRHRPGDDVVETLVEPAARLDAVVDDCAARSSDETLVPYRVVHRAEVTNGEPRPTLIFAYGGYNAPWVPQWPGPMAAFVDAGGVLVHGHLRGGGELGLDWWEQGRMKNKQNGYDDLFAIAEDLIARGWTTSGQLACTGFSNGGLMAGNAITQRPDLWRAVVPRVPFVDLIGACRGSYGKDVVAMEWGDPDDPDDVPRIASISPYQRVEDGTAYPAVFLDIGGSDPRSPAWHGRKFGARLQEATASDRPIFIRVWDDVGHGHATAKDAAVTQATAWLAFVIDQLGGAEGMANVT